MTTIRRRPRTASASALQRRARTQRAAEFERLTQVARHTSNAMSTSDMQLRITWVNEAFTRISGYTLAEALGKTPGELVGHERSDPAVRKILADTAAAGEGCRVEILNRAKDGREYWYDLEVQPMRDAAGRLTGFMEIGSDVTARHAAQVRLDAALRDNQALLRALNLHAIVTVADRDGIITDANEAFCHLTGYSREEFIGRSHRIVNSGVHPPAFWAEMWKTIASGTPWRSDVCNRAKDGTLYWVDTFIAPFRGADGEIEKYISIRTDISASKRAERELARERLQLSNILEGTDVGTWQWNVATGEAVFNERWAEIAGYTLAEVAPADIDTLQRLAHPADLARAQALLRRHFRGELPRFECEMRLMHREGHWVWVLDRGKVAAWGEDGKPRWMAGTRMDITARKQAETALQASQALLDKTGRIAGVGGWSTDLDTRIVTWTDQTCRIHERELGHKPTLDECISYYTPEWRPTLEAAVATAVAGGKGWDLEVQIVTGTGRRVWVRTLGEAEFVDGRAARLVGALQDISERRRVDAELRASQALLDRAGRLARVGGWMLDLRTLEVHWSDETCRIHDREPGFQPTMADNLSDFRPEAAEAFDQALRRGIKTGEPIDLEVSVTTVRGRDIWVRLFGEVEFVNGRAVRLLGAIQDITAQKALRMELTRNNEVLNSVLENMPCGLSVFDADLNLVASNRQFREVLGLPDSLFEPGPPNFETIIRYNADRGEYGDLDPEAHVRDIVERARLPAVQHLFERTRPDGTTLEVHGGPMPGGGFVTTYTDISERKRATAEADRANTLLRGSIDALDDAFALFDPEDRLVLCNQRYRELYPLTRDAMVPGVSFEAIVRFGAERGQYAEAVGRVDDWVRERMVIHRQPVSRLLQRLADGRTLRIVERRMPDGHTVGFRVDITELVNATEAAQQASLSKSQFLANMSHEIRMPMNAILGMVALLRRTELTPRQADYAIKTEGAARSLLGLLNDILDFSKVEAGKMTLDPQPFQIEPLLRDLSVILSANVGEKNVEVLFDIDPALPRQLVGDAMRLQQVLINLAGNAIKFTPEGEVVVAMRLQAREADAVQLEIAVTDTGIGIAPENQSRIFSGFTQAEASTTRRFGGSGLGLAISQRLIAMMGGELQIDSALGRGSRFHFSLRLPLALGFEAGTEPGAEAGMEWPPSVQPDAQADVHPAVAAPIPAARSAPLRALVVDDNATTREVMARMGRSLGWTVEAAESGEQALALLQSAPEGSRRFQAVFVDCQMPGLDGWETSRRIHNLPGPTPVVVMVTAHGHEVLARRGEADQALLDGFLVKPITATMLREAVRDARAGHPHPQHGVRRKSDGAQPLAGMRLLVVEDNPNNQQVARELLEAEGALVQIAQHGREGVEAVAAADPPFDVVLMDLQMPVMDGFTATRRIREDLGLRELPIVAMTANAMASDRQACLAAGMNDHVGKPFELDHLVGVLRKQAGRQRSSEVRGAPASPLALPEAVSRAADEAGVALAAALNRLGNQRGIYQRMLRGFLRDLAPMPAQLRELSALGDGGALARALHTLKGLAATLGAKRLSAAAAAAEKAVNARSNERALAPSAAASAMATADGPADFSAELGTAIAGIEEVRPGLEALLRTLEALDAPPTPAALPADAHDPASGSTARHASAPTAAAPLDVEALRSCLQLLASQLADADMAATDTMADLTRRFGATLGPRLTALDEALFGLDFQLGLRLCNRLTTDIDNDPTGTLPP